MNTDTGAITRFFAAHFGGPLLAGETVEIRALPPLGGKRYRGFFTDYGEAARACAKHAPTHNIFFGSNPRRGEDGTKRGVSRILYLHADLDAKHFGGDMQETSDAAFSLPFLPCRLVCTGGGYHAYYPIEPLPASPENIARCEAAMAGIERTLGIDKLHDVSRILRVPGTLNLKPEYPEPFLARVMHAANEPPASWAALAAFLAAHPEPRKAAPARTRSAAPEDGEEWTVDRIADLLRHIPPTESRDDWLQVVMAVHSVLPDEGGFLAVDEWSSEAREENGQTCSLRADPGLWDRIRRDGHEGSVTIRTLMGRARDNGWAPKPAFQMVDRRTLRAHEEEERKVREELATNDEYAPLARAELPHWLGVLVDYLRPTALGWDTDWTETLALGALSVFFPDIRMENLGVNLWWLGISEQSAGKSRSTDEAFKVVRGLSTALGQGTKYVTVATPEGYAKAHAGYRATVCGYHVEYSSILASFRREHMSDARQLLCAMYDGSYHNYERSRDSIECEEPHSAVIATTTVYDFLQHADVQHLYNGYLSRFMFCFPENNGFAPRWRTDEERRVFVRELADALRPVREIQTARFVLPAFSEHQEPPVLLEYTRGLGINNGKRRTQQDMLDAEPSLPPGRLHARVKKVAVLLALLEQTPRIDNGTLVVSDERVAQAIRLVQRGAMQADILIRRMGGSQDARYTEKIIKFLRNHPHGETERKIVMGVAGLEYKVSTPILKGLVADGAVAMVNTGRTVLYALQGR